MVTSVREAMQRASEKAAKKAAVAAVPPPPLKLLVIEHLALIESTRRSKQVSDPTNVWAAVAKELTEALAEGGVSITIQPSSLKTYFKQAKRGILRTSVEPTPQPALMLAQSRNEQQAEKKREPATEVVEPISSEVAAGHRAPSAPPPSLHLGLGEKQDRDQQLSRLSELYSPKNLNRDLTRVEDENT